MCPLPQSLTAPLCCVLVSLTEAWWLHLGPTLILCEPILGQVKTFFLNKDIFAAFEAWAHGASLSSVSFLTPQMLILDFYLPPNEGHQFCFKWSSGRALGFSGRLFSLLCYFCF